MLKEELHVLIVIYFLLLLLTPTLMLELMQDAFGKERLTGPLISYPEVDILDVMDNSKVII